jgi:hypothetical protein
MKTFGLRIVFLRQMLFEIFHSKHDVTYITDTTDFSETSKSGSKQGLFSIRILLYSKYKGDIEGFNVNSDAISNIRVLRKHSSRVRDKISRGKLACLQRVLGFNYGLRTDYAD